MFILFLLASIGNSQNGMCVEYSIINEGLGGLIPNLNVSAVIRGKTMLIKAGTKTELSSVRLQDSVGLTIYNNRLINPDCMNDTWENVAKAAKEESYTKIVDVEIKKVPGEEKTILGHTCKKAIINYNLSSSYSTSTGSSIIWYTTDYNVGIPYGMQDPLVDGFKEYSEAISGLGGAVLSTETEVEAMGFVVKTIGTCTKIEATTITDDQLKLDMKGCLRTLSAKKYIKITNRRSMTR